MTPFEIKSALSHLGGGANKSLGQHFLIDDHVLETMVATAFPDIRSDRIPGIQEEEKELVLEIGPGLGVLTRALVRHGAEVIAIEQDRRFLPLLSEEGLGEVLEPRPGTNTPSISPSERGRVKQVIHGNAVDLDWNSLVGDRPWKFVSNLPYSITSFAIRKALYETRPPSRLVVLIQREVAERCVDIAPHGRTSLLSLMIALSCSRVRIIRRVARGAFFPPPKVESAILELIPMTLVEREARFGTTPEKIMALAKKGFAHPRKQLASNLGGDAQIKQLLVKLTGTEKVRAEDLSPDQWAELAKHQ